MVIDLAHIRTTAGVTQVQLAERLGVGQSQVSRTEHRTDIHLSTLISYLAALGVRAELTVTVPGGKILNQLLTAPREDSQ
ncbi:MAG: helix-turn-helix transcriptional regulator [Mycobacterium sp.]|nr:helix-turn-helix transcriptional regulator [Mycobacterium sp.]